MPNKEQFYQRSWDIENPNGVIVLIHGLAEHTERYQALGDFLTNNSFALMAIDLPGHGRSGGVPGHIDRFIDYHDAVKHLHKSAKQKYPDTPIFLLGHSMGGLISTHFLLKNQKLFQGALLSGAAIETPQTPPNWQVSLITAIAKIFPKLGLLKLDAQGISQDNNVVKKYMEDPLIFKGKLSARFITEMFFAADHCKNHAQKINLPIFIMHGGSDTITKPEGSEYLYNTVSSKDKTLKIYEGLFHEIFNEPSAPSIYSELVEWLNSHC